MKFRILFFACFFYLFTQAVAQVKIGNNPTVIDANSLLELESTTKGFLPPRVAINSVSAVAPLTGTVPAGMLVYSTGGTVADGYYYWDGSLWTSFKGESSLVSKTANATLTKNEKFVLASNSITLTLPVVTAADNGLSITIKNIGIHTDLITVAGNGAATIDGIGTSSLYRWVAKTFVAYNGNWIDKGKTVRTDNIFDVSASGSWTSIEEVIDFLDLHMAGPSVVRLASGDYPITTTQVIDLPYPLTIQGSSYGTAIITADAGLTGELFDCLTETYFKMLAFDGTAYGTLGAGEDAVHLGTNGDPEYYEIKDCTFFGFHKAIVAEAEVEMWIFEVDIDSAISAGIELAAGAASLSLKISETDFLQCGKGINFLSGTDPIVSVLNCGFYNNAGQIGINYEPATFLTLSNVFITNNTWNNVGTFMTGFDFTRSDGRDANTFIRNNSGAPDRNPNCRISVTNNGDPTTITTAGTWYKANWTSQSSSTTNWTIAINKITYQPQNPSDGWAIITGNITVPQNNRTISISIVKNGDSSTRFGETDLRLTTASQPYQFATTIYLTDIQPGDYFELYCKNSASGETATFQDVQWLTETK
jgi:hypothetical protein